HPLGDDRVQELVGRAPRGQGRYQVLFPCLLPCLLHRQAEILPLHAVDDGLDLLDRQAECLVLLGPLLDDPPHDQVPFLLGDVPVCCVGGEKDRELGPVGGVVVHPFPNVVRNVVRERLDGGGDLADHLDQPVPLRQRATNVGVPPRGLEVVRVQSQRL